VLSAHPGQVAGAATNNVELAAHQSERPARPRLPTKPQVPGTRSSRQGQTAVSSPDNAFTYIHNRSLRELLARHDIQHRRIPPRTPKRNGKIERYQQTLAREWAYGQRYRLSNARATALPIWLNHYNTTRNHGELGNQPPISRVQNLPKQNS
jgi:transposase InsO family protein